MTRKIFRNILLVSLAALILAGGLMMTVVFNFFNDQIHKELKQSAEYIAKGFAQSPDAKNYFSSVATFKTRITWIDKDGTVLYDNIADAATMENHKDRPEVAQALIDGVGQSDRYSNTLSEITLYYTLRLDDGTVLRLSQTQQTVWGLFTRMIPALFVIVAGTVLFCAFIARKLAKRIISPINQMNLEEPEKNEVYSELSPLLVRMAEQNNRISVQLQQITKQQQELSAIAHNMREGLIVLNRKSKILSVNESALKLLGIASKDYAGKYVMELNRSFALQKAVEEAQSGMASERIMELGSRSYQILANPVREQENVAGVIVLLLDVTERQEAENMRREFSANVSHELKTPLTSISGYAEIMKNGVARSEDMSEFASRIYDEANRLINLVDDIIKLSWLDEGDQNVIRESVKLLSLAQEVCGRLDSLAESKHVSLSVEGEEVEILGVKQILEEMIFNLCENAIKYNRENGRVVVTVKTEKGQPVLSVSDTGIGIPLAHQTKVFERFYRVDKSHSKETGGTGLGLSIVKHAAQFHNAKVSLTSMENEGTRVDIKFPSAANNP
ncbi:MAG: sensor histidine kinase [Christensenellales bacterium]